MPNKIRYGPKVPYRGGSIRSLPDINCEYCKKKFRPKGSSTKFCSSSCRVKGLSLRAIHKMFTRFSIDGITGCWNWQGPLNKGGYAISPVTKGLSKVVHRSIFILLIGDVPMDKQLDHLCRNRKCVNPYHLEIVSQKENVRRGLSAKLSYTIVKNIHSLYKKGLKQIDIANMFNINQSQISRVLNNKRWI